MHGFLQDTENLIEEILEFLNKVNNKALLFEKNILSTNIKKHLIRTRDLLQNSTTAKNDKNTENDDDYNDVEVDSFDEDYDDVIADEANDLYIDANSTCKDVCGVYDDVAQMNARKNEKDNKKDEQVKQKLKKQFKFATAAVGSKLSGLATQNQSFLKNKAEELKSSMQKALPNSSKPPPGTSSALRMKTCSKDEVDSGIDAESKTKFDKKMFGVPLQKSNNNTSTGDNGSSIQTSCVEHLSNNEKPSRVLMPPTYNFKAKSLQEDEDQIYKQVDAADLYQGMWDCAPDEDNELPFKRGQIVHIISKEYDKHGWWIAKRKDKVGFVPKNYLMEAYEM